MAKSFSREMQICNYALGEKGRGEVVQGLVKWKIPKYSWCIFANLLAVEDIVADVREFA